MEVRCDRCDTEYDFDDALVSERGTTVRCTNCGHQFKVFPAKANAAPDLWLVRTRAGHQFTFASLRELQSGLAAGRIGPDDELERGGLPPRSLRSIAELEPFFHRRLTATARGGTLSGVAPPNRGLATQRTGGTSPGVGAKAVGGNPRAPSSDRQRRQPERGGDRVDPAPRSQTSAAADTAGSAAASGDVTSHSSVPPTLRRERTGDSTATTPRVPSDAPEAAAPAGARSADGPSPASLRRPPVPATPDRESHGSAAGRVEPKSSPQGRTADPQSSPERASHEAGAASGSSTDKFERARALAPPTPRSAPPPAETAEGVATPRRPALIDQLLSEADNVPSSPEASKEAPAREPPPVTAAAESPESGPALEPPSEPGPPVELSDQFYTAPLTAAADEGPSSDPDSRYVVNASRRGARSRWIVGLVLVGGMTLVGLSVGRRYFVPARPAAAQPSASSSAHGQAHQVARAALGLLEQGELDRAAEKLAQARLLADKDPVVLGALVQLANVRADLIWLRLRLLDSADREVVEHTKRQLDGAVAQAAQPLEMASEVAPQDIRVLRARVNWLRLKGELAQARELVGPLGADPGEPANAYVLGALDLAEPTPVWPSVLERLRTASRAEQGLGLARAALVYALVRAGQLGEARTQLARMEASSGLYPYLGELGAFIRRQGEPSAGSSASAAALDEPDSRAHQEGTAPEREIGEDPREQLIRARTYLSKGDAPRAEALYRSVLALEPGNTEALAGLADVARSRNDPQSAEMYDQVLAKNPTYLPALMARAELKWSSGDKPGAIALYRRVLDQGGYGSEYGQRAAARLAEAAVGEGSAKAHPSASARASSSGVDTTDIPGF